jgi:hypothetical protein
MKQCEQCCIELRHSQQLLLLQTEPLLLLVMLLLLLLLVYGASGTHMLMSTQ